MAQPWAKAFYLSRAWQLCRESYITRVHGLCERCEDAGYIVHHKVYLTSKNIIDAAVALNHENLEYLCLSCHNKEHHSSSGTSQFDENGDCIPPNQNFSFES